MPARPTPPRQSAALRRALRCLLLLPLPVLILSLIFGLSSLARTARGERLRLATLEWPPYTTQTAPGGFVQTIVREALARRGISVQYVFLPWKRAVQAAQNGEADGYFPEYPYTGLQQSSFTSIPLPAGPLVLMTRRDSPLRFTSLDDLKPYRIGVVSGYVNSETFDARTDLTKDLAANDESNVLKLLAGRVDVIVIDLFVGKHILGHLPREKREQLQILNPPLENKSIVVCFPKSLPHSSASAKELDEGLRQLAADGFITATLNKYGLGG